MRGLFYCHDFLRIGAEAEQNGIAITRRKQSREVAKKARKTTGEYFAT
jgi:hypothetical protein